MKQGWTLNLLGEVVKFQGGSQPPKSTFVYEPNKGYIRLLQIRDFKSDEKAAYIPISLKNRTCEIDDVLIGRYGASVGKICTGKSGAYNVALIKASHKTEILNKQYFIFYLRSILFQKKLLSVSERSAQNGFNKDDISGFPIPIPSLDEQKRIVAKLDKCFEAIDKARANVEKNLNNAKELFQSKLNEIFSQKGDGWVEKKLAETFIIRPKKNQVKEVLNEEDMVTFLPMTDLKVLKKDIVPKQQKQLKQVYSGYTYFSENDLLLAKITPCFENGKLGIAKNLKNGIGFGSSEYIVFRSKGDVSPEYLFYFLSRDSFRIEGTKKMQGAVGHKRVSKEFIEQYFISYPNEKIQKQIVDNLNKVKSQTQTLESNYQQEFDALDELKKSILQKAFNGEL